MENPKGKLTHRTVGLEFCTEQDFYVKILRLSAFAHKSKHLLWAFQRVAEPNLQQFVHQDFPCLLGIFLLAVVDTGFSACFVSPMQCEATGNQHNRLHEDSYVKQLECINNCWSGVLSIFHTKQMFAFITVVLCWSLDTSLLGGWDVGRACSQGKAWWEARRGAKAGAELIGSKI